MEDRLLREKQILGDKKAKPPIEPIIPVSRSTWWEGIRSGRFPEGKKLGRIRVWKESTIRKIVEE